MRSLLRALGVVGFAGLLCFAAAPAAAQCGPDNLDTPPCCGPATAILPTFPFLQQTSRFVSFNSCNTQLNVNLCATIGPPVQAMSGGFPVCGVYLIRFSFQPCGSGNVIWSGTLRAQYARNWQEIDASGIRRGVWRLLLNGDMIPSASLPANPAIKPPCAASFLNRVYMTGYIDYAEDCTGNWEAAWCFQHECDMVSHSTVSARPLGASHPTRSYVFLGPAAGFVVSPGSGPVSPVVISTEAFRANDWTALPNICRLEEPLIGGTLNPLSGFCLCNSAGLNQQYFPTVLQVGGACGSMFDTTTSPIGPIPFSLKRIGAWTSTASFPGPQTLLLAFGSMNTTNGCTSATQLDHVEGVQTITGNLAISYTGIALGSVFTDLGSSDRPNNTMIIGAPHVSWLLLGAN